MSTSPSRWEWHQMMSPMPTPALRRTRISLNGFRITQQSWPASRIAHRQSLKWGNPYKMQHHYRLAWRRLRFLPMITEPGPYTITRISATTSVASLSMSLLHAVSQPHIACTATVQPPWVVAAPAFAPDTIYALNTHKLFMTSLLLDVSFMMTQCAFELPSLRALYEPLVLMSEAENQTTNNF